ncbi:endonuclease domain-containing 1 protein [Rhineura floridana]|uniref:endonuclease domain-containing 1 protein n=1 Tax=Rhineura floridana TaxID=261503 RepID=UPI002AC85D31|nr:endonuclease domain-containing 1 protein [Rhineura floridana]
MWLSFSVVLIALAFPGLARGKVVGKGDAGFAECDGFFYQRAPPEGLALEEQGQVKICQKYNREPRFATLYSTRDKLPLYSAFRYTEEAAPSGEERWLVEPQIDDPENGLEGMMPEAEITGSVDNLGTNQALTADYVDSGYERGQLNPSSLHKDDTQIATYTLTNAVPMTPPLQEIWHWEIEALVSRGLAPHCENGKGLYLVSGVVPSSLRVKDKVAVPESLWLAACCDDGSKAWSVGFIKQVAAGNRLEDLTVEALEKKLPAGAQLFKNNCGQDRHDPKKLEEVLHSVKEIEADIPVQQAEKSATCDKTSTAKEESGFLKKLFYFIVTPIFKLLKFVFYLVGQIVKYIVHFLWHVIQMIVKGVFTFIKGIATALLNIFIDLARVAVNILNGIAKNIYNVLMITYRILSVPVNLLLDIVSFPFYTLGAIPAVLQDIASGVGGLCLLVIDAITNTVTNLNNVVSYLARKFLPKISSSA